MLNKRILVADDEEITLKVLRQVLEKESYTVDVAKDGEEACLKASKKKYAIVVLDVRMPKKDGLEVLKTIKKRVPETSVIMMTAHGTINNAVEAMKIGAYDYLTKPFDNNDLLLKVRQCLAIQEKIGSNKRSSEETNAEFVGNSREIQRLKSKIQKVKDLDTNILLIGESGSGKGLAARMIHENSNRKKYPFVHVNCAVLPSNLIETELFGHEKGAFTGAHEAKRGKFEAAGKGTIFLDEISTLNWDLQAKLLTVLQDKKHERVGGINAITVESRIITATNENLEEMVKFKNFREDLYYRINVVTIECPPLRYRKEDIKSLALYFLEKFNRKMGKNIKNISDDVWQVFKDYDWPGNIRELENTIESAIALADGSILFMEDLPLRISSKVSPRVLSEEGSQLNVLEMQEIQAIKEALNKHNNHREKAARDLGISRRSLQYKLKKFNLL